MEPPPLTEIVAESLLQIREESGVANKSKLEPMVTVVAILPEHPAELLTKTVYVVVVSGDAITVSLSIEDKPIAGDQE